MFKKRNRVRPINQFEALDLLVAIMKDVNADRYGSAMVRIGMNPDLFDETQTLDELMGAFQVRLIELAKIAGVQIRKEN